MTADPTFRPEELLALLEAELARAGAPGCAVAVWYDGKVLQAAAGLANALESEPVTARTAFPIGSITKPFTATLIMQLIDEGRLDLEARLTDVLPELTLADRRLAKQVTIRHLLNHTSGIDGDFLVDTGEGDDYLARAITLAAGTSFIHEPGTHFSYCNLGYIVLGRIVEKIRGELFDDVIRERILDPLHLDTAETAFDSGASLARGHTRRDRAWELAPPWPRSNTPCGSRLAMSPVDLVTFAVAHLEGGAPMLSRDGANRMQMIVVETPTSPRCRGWGSGWMRFDWQDHDIFGHDGGIAGCSAFLRIAPKERFAVALAINGGNHSVYYRSMMRALMARYLRIDAPPPTPVADESRRPETDTLVGRYERRGLYAEISNATGALVIQAGGEYGDPSSPAFPAIPATPPLFIAQVPGSDSVLPFHFLQPDRSGRPAYLHFQDRLYKRVT